MAKNTNVKNVRNVMSLLLALSGYIKQEVALYFFRNGVSDNE
jgi:hypothetical protein